MQATTAQKARLKRIVAPHIDSFNSFLEEGLGILVSKLQPVVAPTFFGRIHLWISQVKISKPTKPGGAPLFPSQCRQAGITYDAPIRVVWNIQLYKEDSGYSKVVTFEPSKSGRFPIMLGSNLCHLAGMTPQQLVKHQEDEQEVGGYFVANGQEKIVRLLACQKANYPMFLRRGAYTSSGADFSECAVSLRSVNKDQTISSFMIHYLKSGGVKLRFNLSGSMFMSPILVFRCLVPCSDREIYEKIVAGNHDDNFLTERVEVLIKEAEALPKSQEECLEYVGKHLKFQINGLFRDSHTNREIAQEILRERVCSHLESYVDKYEFLIQMIRKLYHCVRSEAKGEDADSPMLQDIITPGQFFSVLFKNRLQESLYTIGGFLKKLYASDTATLSINNIITKINPLTDVTKKMTYFLSTGNTLSSKEFDIRQKSGFVVIADRINYMRFIAGFQAVHRGASFMEMRTTSPRKLLPGSWGFLCPVHTPDGAICGLLNHLTEYAQFSQTIHRVKDQQKFISEMMEYGLLPSGGAFNPGHFFPVFLDGALIGHLPPAFLQNFETVFRAKKVLALEDFEHADDRPRYTGSVTPSCEFVVVPFGEKGFPSISIFSHPNRLLRPVTNLLAGRRELIGALEQAGMNIAVVEEEIIPEVSTHLEEHPTRIFSIHASLTPFCNNNQSPRNMYQCQMLKQTMGTPLHNWPYRADNKMFRILTPQSPIVKNKNHDRFPLDDYLTGANAVVAVLAYTGYDMEDAMIINKSAFERGFAHGYVYKSERIDLIPPGSLPAWFCNIGDDGNLVSTALDEDGLPFVGDTLQPGDPYYCHYNSSTKKFTVVPYSGKETAYVEGVINLGYGSSPFEQQGDLGVISKVCIQLRFLRRPTRGDKFSSRHGQKGVLSQLYPQVDLPFTESGMTPDVIINPNAFPSRMTIGMLIESMAGKAGALQAVTQDSTPFHFDEKNTAVAYFGEQLVKSGYNYYGNEVMYSGITGEEFKVDIFFGVVYYQRLRHMVGDKFQARSTGQYDRLTQQPVKGRKKGGGTRFGEMERDSILSHGASFLLHDRLMNSSDMHYSHVCLSCGSILALVEGPMQEHSVRVGLNRYVACRLCQDQPRQQVQTIALPFVTRLLAAEFAACNIRLSLEVASGV